MWDYSPSPDLSQFTSLPPSWPPSRLDPSGLYQTTAGDARIASISRESELWAVLDRCPWEAPRPSECQVGIRQSSRMPLWNGFFLFFTIEERKNKSGVKWQVFHHEMKDRFGSLVSFMYGFIPVRTYLVIKQKREKMYYRAMSIENKPRRVCLRNHCYTVYLSKTIQHQYKVDLML